MIWLRSPMSQNRQARNSPLRGLVLSHRSMPGSASMCRFGFTVMIVTSQGIFSPVALGRSCSAIDSNQGQPSYSRGRRYPPPRELAMAGVTRKNIRRAGRGGREFMERGVNRRTVLAGAGVAATTLASGMRIARAADPVKVGVLFPLTGNAAAAAQASKAAVEIAAEIVNNAHPELVSIPLAKDAGLPGLGGAKLELTFIDHQG